MDPGVRQLQNQASPKESSFWGFPLWVAQGADGAGCEKYSSPARDSDLSALSLWPAVRPAAGRGLSLGK